MVSKEEIVDNLIMLDVEVYLINVNSNLMISILTFALRVLRSHLILRQILMVN